MPEHESKGTHRLPEIMSTTLCRLCQAITIDAIEEKLGATTFTPEDGEPFLDFGKDVEGDDGVFRVTLAGYNRKDELPDLPKLQRSAANGCSFCGVLRSAVLSEFTPQVVGREGPNTSSKKIVLLKNFKHHWISLEVADRQAKSRAYLAFLSVNAVVPGENDELSRDIHFEVCAPPGPLATWLRISRNVADDNPLSPGRIRDIKSWISDCEQNCHHAGITTALPTRLIDVGSEDGRDQMRLIASSDIPTSHHGADFCKYAALSYCWGDSTSKPFFTTRKDTLQQLLRSIPMECLPRTCRDAVMVTRYLGIRYLWIDALCILQDDPDDWAKESSIMGQIYTNSWLTLIAWLGGSCHDGFLDRKTAMKAPIYYKSSLRPDVDGIYWLRQVSSNYAAMRQKFGEFGEIAQDMVKSKWRSRGWTLQEDLLSTRRLIFGTETMYYSCGENIQTERAARRLTKHPWSEPFLDLLFEEQKNPKDVYHLWYTVLGEYGQRNLTYPKDRLPAISGLAQIFQKKMAGNYLAGLWQSDLFEGLLWITVPWGRLAMRGETFMDSIVHPKSYTAPSWSWARWQQAVSFVRNLPSPPENVPEIEVLEATTSLIGPNPFGRVENGHLLLRGKTFGLEEAQIFGVDKMKVDRFEWVQGKIWLEVISHNGIEIAHCVRDWEPPEATKDFEICEAPWDQLMIMIVASHSIDTKVDENEGDHQADKGEEDRQSGQGEEDNKDGEGDKKNNSSEDLRQYFGLLLLPTAREADSWVRVGVCMLRSDIHGRTVLDNCSEKIVKLV